MPQNELYGEQTVPMYFMVTTVNPNPRNAMNKIVVTTAKQLLENSKTYESIEELIADQPENISRHDVKTLARHIALDSNRGFGEVYEEYGVVAYSGIHKFDRPIAKIEVDGKTLYVPSNEIHKTLKRI